MVFRPRLIALPLALLFANPAEPIHAGEADAPPVLSWLEHSAVIGGHNILRLQSPPGKTLSAVVWEIEGTIVKQVIHAHGFTNTPLPCPLIDRPPADATESVVSFNWDGTLTHSITVTVEYTDGTIGMPNGITDRTPD